MASVSSNKKVAKAAKAGGGRSRAQTSTSWGYYGTLIGIAALGSALIGLSIFQTREDPGVPYMQTAERSKEEFDKLAAVRKKFKGKPEAAELKAAEKDYENYVTNNHIHAAYSVYDCTQAKGAEWLLPVNGEGDPDPKGIHAHADGLIHAHPFSRSATGRRATLAVFFEATGLSVGKSSISLPAKAGSTESPSVVATKARKLEAGAKCKNGKKAVVKVFEYKDAVKNGKSVAAVKGLRVLGEAGEIRIEKNHAYVFALIDADTTPPMPPSVKALEAPSDQIGASGDADTTPPMPPSVKAAEAPTSVGTKTATTVAAKAAPTTVKVAPTTAKK